MNPESKFFTAGAGRKIVITEHDAAERLHVALGDRSEIVAVKHISARHILEALAKIGVRKLMVEGGSMVLSMFVSVRMFDSFRLAVAPFFVGEDAAPRLRADVGIDNLHLTYAESLGGMAVLHYDALRSTLTDAEYMRMAVDESRKCVPSCTSYSVGAVIVTKDNQLFTGYTHETGDKNHAEEEAMMKAEAAGADLHGAAIYCSMEPCSQRHSKPVSCSALIINHKMGKVFYALEEPANFVDCEGAQLLRKAGIKTMHLDGFEGEVVAINGHILK
jgi:pyrimidine deaminase RibD-like protein